MADRFEQGKDPYFLGTYPDSFAPPGSQYYVNSSYYASPAGMQQQPMRLPPSSSSPSSMAETNRRGSQQAPHLQPTQYMQYAQNAQNSSGMMLTSGQQDLRPGTRDMMLSYGLHQPQEHYAALSTQPQQQHFGGEGVPLMSGGGAGAMSLGGWVGVAPGPSQYGAGPMWYDPHGAIVFSSQVPPTEGLTRVRQVASGPQREVREFGTNTEIERKCIEIQTESETASPFHSRHRGEAASRRHGYVHRDGSAGSRHSAADLTTAPASAAPAATTATVGNTTGIVGTKGSAGAVAESSAATTSGSAVVKVEGDGNEVVFLHSIDSNRRVFCKFVGLDGSGACSSSFSRFADFRLHYLSKHLGRGHICNECKLSFPKESQLITHQLSHNRVWWCRHCGFPSESRTKNSQHQSVCKMTACDTCHMTVSSDVSGHSDIHQGTWPHICEGCGWLAPSARELSSHRESQHPNAPPAAEEKQWRHQERCKVCQLIPPSPSAAERHHIDHDLPSSLLCPAGCSLAVPQAGLINHMTNSHGAPENNALICPICGTPFPGNSRALQAHIEAHLHFD